MDTPIKKKISLTQAWFVWVMLTIASVILAVWIPGVVGKMFTYISFIIFFLFCIVYILGGKIEKICLYPTLQDAGIVCDKDLTLKKTIFKYVLPFIMFTYIFLNWGIYAKGKGELGMSLFGFMIVFAILLMLNTSSIDTLKTFPIFLKIKNFVEGDGGGGEGDGDGGEGDGDGGEGDGDGGEGDGGGGMFKNLFGKKKRNPEKLTTIAANRDYTLEENIKTDQEKVRQEQVAEQAPEQAAEQAQEIEMKNRNTDADAAAAAAAAAAADTDSDTTTFGGGLFGKSKTPLQKAEDKLTKDEKLANSVIGAQDLKKGDTEITDLTGLNEALGIQSIESLPDENKFQEEFKKNITAQSQAPSDSKLRFAGKLKSAAASAKAGVKSAASVATSVATSAKGRFTRSTHLSAAAAPAYDTDAVAAAAAAAADNTDAVAAAAADNTDAATVGGGRRKTKSARRTLRKKLIPGGVL